MALKEFEPIPARYFAKIKNSHDHELKGEEFMCSALSPKEANRISVVKGLITSSTRLVVYTTNKKIKFVDRGLVEILGDRYKITQLVTDVTDANIMAAKKISSEALHRMLPKWMVLE